MALWGLAYMDVDERWWVDLALAEQAPPVRYVTVGSRGYCDGFDLADGALLVRRASLEAAGAGEWPADEPVRLGPLRAIPTG
jgi:hypothetical protein